MSNLYITIGREFGSGGREIGKKVAKALNIPYYDKELMAVAAQESGLSPQFLQSYDEKPTNSFLYSLVMGHQGMITGHQTTSVDQMAANAQRDAILSVADKGSCVIVGRCADYILRDRLGLVRIFITADLDARIARVSKRDGLDPKAAEEKIRRMDKTRASYYSFHTDRKWGAAECFDMCLSSSFLGVDKAAELILKLCEGMEK